MYVKKSWNTQRDKKKVYYHIAESYRDENGKPKQRLLVNISSLPEELIDLIDRHLKGEKLVGLDEVDLSAGDSLEGAGTLALYKLWNDFGIEKVLKGLTKSERESVFAMVWQRIFCPSSRLSLKDKFETAVFSGIYSKNRTDEDTLYSVMDKLEESFYSIQDRIMDNHDTGNSLILYDTTSTYFEGRLPLPVAEVSKTQGNRMANRNDFLFDYGIGRKAQGGEYGYSKDHRSDRYQIVIGLVCNGEGIPVSVEVWPGSTSDKATVKKQVNMLKERFGLERAVFIGDKGMYTSANIEEITKHGFDYILSTQWQTQKKQLIENAPEKRELFDDYDVAQWYDEGKRYICCHSEAKKQRQQERRRQGLIESDKELRQLQKTAQKGRYYTSGSLAVKINRICERYGVKDLWEINCKPIDDIESPEDKSRFRIEISIDREGVRKRKAIEGRYVLETSVSEKDMEAKKVIESYKELKKIEKAFRDIKSFLEIRPVYHWRERRIRAHVLICFLAFYITKRAGKLFKEAGWNEEAVKILRDWEKLKLCEQRLETSEKTVSGWNWTMGKTGKRIKSEIKQMNWWRSIQGYKCSVTTKINDSP